MLIAAAAIVVWVVWPGRSSDAAVPINRIEIPLLLVVLALLPLRVRRFFGPVRCGRSERTVCVVGYLVVLALIANHAVDTRDERKLGTYVRHGFQQISTPVSPAASLSRSPATPPRS